MDAAALRERIRWTFDPNADLRRQAELDLKHVRVPRPISTAEAHFNVGRGATRLCESSIEYTSN